MKNFLLSLALILLAGCEYDVPLAKTAAFSADTELAGNWIGKDSDGKEVPMEIQVDGSKYKVIYGGPESDSLSFTGFEVRAAGLHLIQLALQDSGISKFLFVKYELTPEGLNVYRLSPDVVSSKCQTTEELAADLEIHRNNPFLFDEPLKFTRSAAQ